MFLNHRIIVCRFSSIKSVYSGMNFLFIQFVGLFLRANSLRRMCFGDVFEFGAVDFANERTKKKSIKQLCNIVSSN